MLESVFQSNLIKELESMFEGCVILNNDGNDVQGFPDVLILFEDTWAALECKRHKNSEHRPNQDYYIDNLGKMSFAAFIYPENKQGVLNELQQTFTFRRSTRFSKRL